MKKILALAALLLLTACTTRPILNVQNEPVPTRIGQQHTQADVERAILVAAQRRKWNARVVRPGLIEASTAARSHQALVEISYSATNYSVRHKQSANLKESDGNIHRNYNRWVGNLNKEIRRQLTR